jgi:bifunctional enzyme Fae/Hps
MRSNKINLQQVFGSNINIINNVTSDTGEEAAEYGYSSQDYMLDKKKRYLQIAFNSDLNSVEQILPRIDRNERILIEAGTPFLKREGMNGIRRMAQLWDGLIVADLKTADGAVGEVQMARAAGAGAATVLGSCPSETLNLFIKECKDSDMYSMIDMIGVEDPLHVLRKLKFPPDVMILHRGRDEESTRGKIIEYKNVNKIRSKYDVLISAAGGVDLREARSAIFNGANIVVANIVGEGDPWTGINDNDDVAEMAKKFLETIE